MWAGTDLGPTSLGLLPSIGKGGGAQRPGRHSSWTNSLGLHALQEIIPGFIYRTAHGGGMLIGQLTEVGCLTAGLAEDSRL